MPRRASHQAVDEPIVPSPITTTSVLCAVMQARRYAAANLRSVSRNWDDLQPLASDDELVEWAKELNADPEPEPRPRRRNRPLVATRTNSTLSTEELLVDIRERATKAYRVRVSARR